ncbi:hypothetical protein Dimus_016562 [Dionaea muscipula]
MPAKRATVMGRGRGRPRKAMGTRRGEAAGSRRDSVQVDLGTGDNNASSRDLMPSGELKAVDHRRLDGQQSRQLRSPDVKQRQWVAKECMRAGNILSTQDQVNLCKEFTVDDVVEALKGINVDKTPGIDG